MEPVTIAEIGRRTNISPSNLRYYREKFGAFIPTEGTKRQRIHPDSAITIFQGINDLFKQGLKARQVEKVLEQRFGRVVATAIEAQRGGKTLVDGLTLHTLLASMNSTLQSINETLQLQKQFMGEWKALQEANHHRLATQTQSEQNTLKETLSKMKETILEKEKELIQKRRLIWLVSSSCLLAVLSVVLLVVFFPRFFAIH